MSTLRTPTAARCALLGLVLAVACAEGGDADGTSRVTFGSGSAEEGDAEGEESSAGAEASEGSSAESSEDSTGTGDGDDEGEDGCGPCDTPPGDCWEGPGSCVAGECEYEAKIAGSDCGVDGLCDAMGTCIGGDGDGDCTAPHAIGTPTGGGGCSWQCQADWGDCNSDIELDGCETNLTDTVEHCGGCGNDCRGDNLAASCSQSACERSCTGDYENCDGDWDNGCEIPTGVPQVCDQNGIRTDGEGCWTAYCGTNTGASANFGTYHCVHCANCNMPTASSCRWCDSGSGNFFPPEASCGCGSFEDLVCGPL